MLDENEIDFLKKSKGMIAKGLIGLVGLIVLSMSVWTLDGGEQAIHQDPFGNETAVYGTGIHFKYPIGSKIYKYNQDTTVSYVRINEDTEYQGTSTNPPFDITFGDTYGGKILGSFRLVMPQDPKQFITIHKAFKRYNNLVENGMEKFTNEILSYTANQFTGEDFMQGGQNDFKLRSLDQAKGGLYQTKRQKVNDVVRRAKVNVNSTAGSTDTTQSVVYKNVIQRDKEGKILRLPNPLEQYGIKITQVTIEGFIPEKALDDFMVAKKKRVEARAKIVENQTNERQKAITAKLRGDRERIEAKQLMLKDKDSAEITAKKEVELAKLRALKEKVERQKLADLAKIDKVKQLQIAKANKGIQEANYKSAKFEAQAILEKGLAQAKVKEANYKAIDKVVFKLETNKAIQLAKYKALPNMKIALPKNVMINNGSNGKGTKIDDLANMQIIEKMGQLK